MKKYVYKIVSLLTILSVFYMFVGVPYVNAAGVGFGNAVARNPNGTTGDTFSFTTSGTNISLFAFFSTGAGTGLTATFNGVSMSQIQTSAPTAPCGRFDIEFYLANAPATTANIIFTGGGSGQTIYDGADYYTGVSTSVSPDNSAETTQGTGTTNSNTITPVATGTWHVAVFESGSAGQSASVGTQRAVTTAAWGIYDSNGTITAGVANTLTVNQTNQCGNSVGATIAPLATVSNYMGGFMEGFI